MKVNDMPLKKDMVYWAELLQAKNQQSDLLTS